MITGGCVGTRLPPAGSGVTIIALTPLRFTGTPTSAAPEAVTLNSTRVGDGTRAPRLTQTS